MTLKPMQIGLITGFGGLFLLGLVVYGMSKHAPGYLEINKEQATRNEEESELQMFKNEQKAELQRFIHETSPSDKQLTSFKDYQETQFMKKEDSIIKRQKNR